MVNYRLYDLYEGKEFIGEYATLSDCKDAMREYDMDTDGENCMYVERRNIFTGEFYEVDVMF